jgi:hypothetical protein
LVLYTGNHVWFVVVARQTQHYYELEAFTGDKHVRWREMLIRHLPTFGGVLRNDHYERVEEDD